MHDAAQCNYDSTWVASVSQHCKSVTNLVQGEGRAVGCAGVAVGAGVCQQGSEQESAGDSCPRRTRWL